MEDVEGMITDFQAWISAKQHAVSEITVVMYLEPQELKYRY